MPAQTKLFLRSLTIHEYEQFRSCPRIEFSPEHNLLLGVNGSGKTSLVRLLGAILRFHYDALLALGQPFHVEFELGITYADDAWLEIHGDVHHEPPSLPRQRDGQEQARLGRRGSQSIYEGFAATFVIRYKSEDSFTVTVRDSWLEVERPGGEETSAHKTGRPMESWLADVLGAQIGDQGYIEHRARDTFVVRETDIDFWQLTDAMEYQCVVDTTGGRPYVFMHGLEYRSPPEDRQWFRLLDDVVNGTVDTIASQPHARTFLPPVVYERHTAGKTKLDISALLPLLGAEQVSVRLKLTRAMRVGDRPSFEGKGVEVSVRFRSGTEVTDTQLTFGQKRLFTIAVGALMSGGSPMLVDELDNGLHPALVEEALRLMAGRQTFITTHNKLVVDLLNYDSAEDICRTIHICRRNEDGSQSIANLADAEVREIFEQIEIGVMNPSDVLRREGLW